MNCRQVEEKLADWSADNLPERSCSELQEHLQQCSPCAHHWNEFQQTVTTVSTSSQPLLSPQKSQEMWRCCERYLAEKAERERNEQRNVQSTRSKPDAAAFSWWNINPRWGWASLAGAFVVLAAAGLAPQNITRPTNEVSAPIRVAVSDKPLRVEPREEWIRFTLPPTQASPFINHHAAMAFDPFADHVASTLISDAATNVSTQAVPIAVSDSSFADSQRQSVPVRP